MQLYLRRRVYLPRPGQFKRKEAKEEEFPPVEKSREAPVQTGHPGLFLVPWTSFYNIPAHSIQLCSCREDKRKPAYESKVKLPVPLHSLAQFSDSETQIRCTPDGARAASHSLDAAVHIQPWEAAERRGNGAGGGRGSQRSSPTEKHQDQNYHNTSLEYK